jgi:L-malate glycosyltransferase
MKIINILFVIIQMGMGGSEQLVLNIIKKLDRKRFSPHLAYFHGQKPLSEFTALGIPIFHVAKTKRFDLGTMSNLGDIIKKHKIDVVNAHHFLSMIYSFYGCKVKNKAKLIYTEHSVWEVLAVPKKWELIGSLLLKFIDAIVGVSDAVSGALRKKYSIRSNKSHTIQNGIDLPAFELNSQKDSMKPGLGIKENEKVIGIVANLKKVKNHLLLLNAFLEVAHECDNVKLAIIGRGFDDDPDNTEFQITSFIKEHNLKEKVLMLGYRSDIPKLLAILDIFCLCSSMEGLPISIIEAMASGLPVVGTKVDGIVDVIQNGENGFLIPLNDVKGLKDILITLLNDSALRRSIGQKAKQHSMHYSLSNCVNKYETLFSIVSCDRL